MQPTVKISNLPKTAAPATTDKMPLVHGTETDYALISDLITLFFNNIPSGTVPGLTNDYVISGGVWTGDSYAVNRNASMTSISVYLGQRTIAIGAVTARTFTASKDTYIDILNNLDGTGTLVYTEVTNNVASPALAANSMRIGIIVTGATTIAAVGSVNQGQEDKVLPIASSVAYTSTDSLGNLICTRDPIRRTLGIRQLISSPSNANGTATAINLSVPVIVPTLRKIRCSLVSNHLYPTTGNHNAYATIWEGASLNTLTNQKQQQKVFSATASAGTGVASDVEYTPTSTLIWISAALHGDGGGITAQIEGGASDPLQLKVELA